MKDKNLILIIDTETANSIAFPLVYDLGYTIMDKKTGEILEKKGWLIKEIWENEDLMSSAYYSKKIPLYANKIRTLSSWNGAINQLLILMEKCSEVYAYNSDFDVRAIKSTNRKINNHVLDITMNCIWSFSQQVLMNRPTYKNFVERHELISPSGKFYSTNAEVCYKYLTQEMDFIEDHMSMEDCEIESYILHRCLRQNKKFDKTKRGWILRLKVDQEKG